MKTQILSMAPLVVAIGVGVACGDSGGPIIGPSGGFGGGSTVSGVPVYTSDAGDDGSSFTAASSGGFSSSSGDPLSGAGSGASSGGFTTGSSGGFTSGTGGL